jgi:Na+-transporting NADH:ubiquinone oxidoreductase subunit F
MSIKYSAWVSDILELTDDVREVRLKLIDPPLLDFTAGQYITIAVTEMKDGEAHLNNRPYSITSSPSEKSEIHLCVNRVGAGPGSSRIHSLKVHDRLDFFVPVSFFKVHQESPKQRSLFVATGTGIAPIKSMIGDLLQTASDHSVLLYWGLRREEDIYYQDAFQEWAKRYPLFQYVITLSQPSSLWQGAPGRVTDHIEQAIEKVDSLDAYLCGKGEMIREVRQILLSKGMEKKAIHFEKFY